MKVRKRRVEGSNVASTLIQHDNERHALALVDPLGVIEHVRYVEFAVHAARWADLLRTHGVRAGDRVVVLAGPDPEWRSALLGVVEAGAAAVPCPADSSLADIRAIADDAGAAIVVSAAPRPDLAHDQGFLVLSTDRLHQSAASDEMAYDAQPDEAALVLYERDSEGLRGAVHTHSSLLAQAEAGAQWLGIGAGERIWTTADEGSIESIWILLAAWHAGAEIVIFDKQLSPEEDLELVARLRPSAVWLSDDAYLALASADVPPWLDLRPVDRALTTDTPGDGASAFHEVFGAPLAPVYGSKETGVFAGCPSPAEGTDASLTGIGLSVIDEVGNELAPGREGELAVAGDAPTLFAGYTGAERHKQQPRDWFHLGRRGCLDPAGVLRFASGAPGPRLDPVDPDTDVTAEVAVVAAAPVPPVLAEPEPDRRREKREAKGRERAMRDEERRLKQEAKAQEQRRRDEAKAQEEAERAIRAAALTEERQRVKEAKEAGRREEQEAKESKARQEAEAKERERAEAEERHAADEAGRAERRRRAEEVEREVRADERRLAEEEQRRAGDRRREEQQLREAAEQAERERLAPNILSTIGHYGVVPADPDPRRESTDGTPPAAATAEVDERASE